MFQAPFRRPRRFISATSLYERQRAGATRRPYHFGRRDGQPVGLWDAWADPVTGERFLTCAVPTTGPNDLMRVTMACR
jgi:putative SOS response-associated peptidase YedK